LSSGRFYKKTGKIEVSYFLPKRDSDQVGSQFGYANSVINRKHLIHTALVRWSEVLRTIRQARCSQPVTKQSPTSGRAL